VKFKKQPFNNNAKKLIFIISIFVAGLLSYPVLIKQYQPLAIDLAKPLDKTLDSPDTINTTTIEACFTPSQACLPKIIKYINNAKISIAILGYSFTSSPITKALINAKKRGVNVQIILDRSQKSQKHAKLMIKELLKADIELKFDHSVKIAHNKVMIIDGQQTLTGSYNWTHAAEYKNAENLLFINSKQTSVEYSSYFKERWKIAKP
jgi:phosphatidylserine/phosphatidylglycerophosphate/cardiolipin synthase-like enzyme